MLRRFNQYSVAAPGGPVLEVVPNVLHPSQCPLYHLLTPPPDFYFARDYRIFSSEQPAGVYAAALASNVRLTRFPYPSRDTAQCGASIVISCAIHP